MAYRRGLTENQQAARVRSLRVRITNPAPPIQPALFDAGMARRFLQAANWDVARAEAMYRRYRARVRAERAAANAAAPATTTTTAAAAAAAAAPTNAPGPAGAVNGPNVLAPAMNNQPSSSTIRPSFQPPPARPQAGAAPTIGSPDDPDLLSLARNTRLPDSEGETEQRDAAITFHNIIQQDHSVLLSITEAVLLLQLARWDIGQALAAFDTHSGALARLRTEYDGLRDLADVPDYIQESKCLQILTEITRRSDWLSLWNALESADWNLIKVIRLWFKRGIPVYKDQHIPKDKKRGPDWGMRVDRWGRRLPRPDSDSVKPAGKGEHLQGWAPDPPSFEDPTNQRSSIPQIWGQQWRDEQKMRGNPQASQALKTKLRKIKDREKGFMLNFDREPLKKGKGNLSQSEFLLEWFHKGKYWFKIFHKSQFTFADVPDDSDIGENDDDDDDNDGDDGNVSPPPSQTGQTSPATAAKRKKPVEFDENDASHIGALNRWRGNTFWLGQQETVQPPTQKWSQAELDFLYQLMVDLLADYKRNYPRMSRRELVPLLEIDFATKQQWQRDFNNRFTGTVAPGEQYPRRDREHGAIIQMRKRFVKLATHFRIAITKDLLKKMGDAEKKKLAEYEKERDALEDADEEVTKAYNEANPTDDPLEGRLNRKKRAARVSRAVEEDDGGDSGEAEGEGEDEADGEGEE